MENELIFGLNKWGEFGMRRFSETLSANEQKTITLNVPAGRKWVIFKYRFGNITAETINFRFDNILNYFEQNILIGTELLNWVVEPKPYIVAVGNNGEIVITNVTNESQNFSIVLDFYVIDDEIQGRMRELIYGKREEFRGAVTSLAGTGGA